MKPVKGIWFKRRKVVDLEQPRLEIAENIALKNIFGRYSILMSVNWSKYCGHSDEESPSRFSTRLHLISPDLNYSKAQKQPKRTFDI